FYTLPVVDGFLWGKTGNPAGIQMMSKLGDQEQPITGGDPIFTNTNENTAHISWPVNNGSFEIDLKENSITITSKGKQVPNWFLDLKVENKNELPLSGVETNHVNYLFDKHSYKLVATKGSFEKGPDSNVFRVKPQSNTLIL